MENETNEKEMYQQPLAFKHQALVDLTLAKSPKDTDEKHPVEKHPKEDEKVQGEKGFSNLDKSDVAEHVRQTPFF